MSDTMKTAELISELTDEVKRLSGFLHERHMHPDYEYEMTKGPRKAWDGDPDMTEEGWEDNDYWRPEFLHGKYTGKLEYVDCDWERYDYHEERYWRKRKSS